MSVRPPAFVIVRRAKDLQPGGEVPGDLLQDLVAALDEESGRADAMTRALNVVVEGALARGVTFIDLDNIKANRAELLDAYLDCAQALRWLVALKTGPRDARYELEKPHAWEAAQVALGVLDEVRKR